MTLPKDPFILLSYINTKLRNEYDTLEDLSQSLQVSTDKLINTLSSIGYIYNQAQNQFILKD